jgi:triosephosphate isomerase
VILIANMNTVNASASLNKSKFLGANWKCNLETTSAVDELVDDLNRMWRSLSRAETRGVELCVNPPFSFIDRVRSRLHKGMSAGSQNASDARGPDRKNTGATSLLMLRSVGCEGVLLSHSDRRNTLGETDEVIAEKVRGAIEAGLSVTLTIGELRSQRDKGRALDTLRKQLGIVAKAKMHGVTLLWHTSPYGRSVRVQHRARPKRHSVSMPR